MVVCPYFLRGTCRFGDRCRNEHPAGRQSQGGAAGAGGGNNKQTPTFTYVQLRAGRQLCSADDFCNSIVYSADTIKTDLTTERAIWKLTCYAPGKNEPNLIADQDVSQEELRWQFYVARAQKNESLYVSGDLSPRVTASTSADMTRAQPEAQLAEKADAAVNNVLNNLEQAYAHARSKSTNPANNPQAGAPAASNSAFGTGGFAQPQQQQGTSAFGSGGVVGAPSGGFGAFSGAKPAGTAFGQQQPSAFGGAAAQAPSTPFGGGGAAPAFGASAFGKPAFGATAAAAAASGSAPAATPAFGSSGGGAFGGGAAAPASGGFGAFAGGAKPTSTFGAPATHAPAPSGSAFGAGGVQGTSAFGSAAPKPAGSGFSAFGSSGASGGFGAFSNKDQPAAGAFGAPAQPQPAQQAGAFGSTGFGGAQSSAFGAPKPPQSSPFGAPASAASASSTPFGAPAAASPFGAQPSGATSAFGQSAFGGGASAFGGGAFGSPASAPAANAADPYAAQAPKMSDLTEADIAAYNADQFELDKIPLMPPPVDVR